MAFPTSATLAPSGVAPALAGITVGVYPSTNLSVTEVQRATAAGAASSLWQTVWNAEATSVYEITFLDRMPLSTRSFFYKARHKRVGFANSAFTKIVSGKPIAMGQVAQPSPTAGAAARYLLAGPGLTTAGAVAGDVINLPLGLQKKLRLTFANAIPQISTRPYLTNANGLIPNTSNLTHNFLSIFTLPSGVTITAIAARVRRKTAASTASIQLLRLTDTGGSANITSYIAATTNTNYQTITSSAMAETVTSTKSYVLFIAIKSTVKGVNNGAYLYADVTYSVPSLDKTY